MNQPLATLILLLALAAASATGTEPAPGEPQGGGTAAVGKPAPHAGDDGAKPRPARKPEKSPGVRPDTTPHPAPKKDEESEGAKAWRDADI